MAFSTKTSTDNLLSAHARYAARAAAACGYGFRSLDGADGYLFEVSDGDRRATFAAGAGTPYALNDARAASIARDKAFCAETLRQAALPVVAGRMYFVTERWREVRSPGREIEDALVFSAAAQYPVFCKPISASNGLYAEVIESPEAFADYAMRVGREHFAILVQPFICAPEHRVFVLNGRALFSYRKALPQVEGDGENPLHALVAAMGREPGAAPLKPRGRDEHGRLLVNGDVPARGAIVTLEGPANRAAGGGARGLRDGAPEDLAALAVAAARAVGLSLAAVDLFDLGEAGLAVIEVNSNPMIATLEDHDRWDLIVEIWRANLEAALK
ncbi:MAG: RimK family alpha-L-glutamate ligase [Hyphomonadaceae bacterium]